MLALFDRQTSGLSMLTELIEVIDSSRSTSLQRLEAISRLEKELGRIVLSEKDEPGPSSKLARHAWWQAQEAPRTCVALSLVHLIHRLHLQCQPDDLGKAKDLVEGDAVCGQFIGCFTILQGLCLKNEESQQICARKGTIELLLDIITADYWTDQALLSNAPAHALDLLICITISSPSASKLVESLKGDDLVRSLMERHAAGREEDSPRKGVTLDQVKNNPLAIKCAEFLLFFEYEREEPARQKARVQVAGEESTMLNESFRSAIDRSLQHRRGIADKKETTKEQPARLTSPIKATRGAREAVKARREERIQAIKSRPLQSSGRDASLDKTPVHTPGSPSKSAPDSMHNKKPSSAGSNSSTKSSLTPFAKAMSPRKGRGRSRSRSPLSVVQQPKDTSLTSSLPIPTSPLKAIMGPSPAVQRAHARSLSPIKRPAHGLA